jgi:hypothetical protein
MTTKTTHVLETSCGVKAVAVFDDEDLTVTYQFVPPPPWNPEITRTVLAEFDPWLDDVFIQRVRRCSWCHGAQASTEKTHWMET